MKVSNFLVESNESIMFRRGTELVMLVEGIAAEMHAISNAAVTKPFTKFKAEQMKVFVTKLKAWAFSTLQELNPSMSFHNPEKNYIATLKKIINNPHETAEQIFTTVISRQIGATTSASPKKELVENVRAMKHLDDILGSITF